MKRKSYLRVMLAAVALLFVAVGCSSDPKDKPEPEPDYVTLPKAGGYYFGDAYATQTGGDFDTFVLYLSDSGVSIVENGEDEDFTGTGNALTFVLNVTKQGSSELPTGTFAASATEKAGTFAIGGLEADMASYISDVGAGSDVYFDGGTLKIEKSGATYTITADVTSGTQTYKYKYTGAITITDKRVVVGELELSISLAPGDDSGENTSSWVTMTASSPTAVAGQIVFGTTEVFAEQLVTYGTYEEIVLNSDYTQELSADQITALNDELIYPVSGAPANTSITVILRVEDADGNSITKIAETTTTVAVPSVVEINNLVSGELSYYGDAYDFPDNDYANWEINLAGDNNDGLVLELNTAKSATTDITPGTYNMMSTEMLDSEFVPFSMVPAWEYSGYVFGTYTYAGNYVAGSMTSGSVTVAKSGDTYTITFELVDDATATTYKGTYIGTLEFSGGGETTVVEINNLVSGKLYYYGDSYGLPDNDYANWEINLAGDNNDGLVLELNTAKSATTDITPGTYDMMSTEMLDSEFVPFSMVPAYTQSGYAFGTYTYAGGYLVGSMTSGSATVAKSGTTYTITFDVTDSETLTNYVGTYTGTLSYTDYSSASAAVPMRVPGIQAGKFAHKSLQLAPKTTVKKVAIGHRELKGFRQQIQK